MHKLVLALLLLLSLPMSTEAQATIELGDYINSLGVARGPILLPDGTAAAPSAAFANDTTSGLYRVGTANLGLSVAGTRRISFWPDQVDLTLSGVTGTSATSAFKIAQLWNTTGAPTLFFANVTDTASDAASLLMDLQVGSVSKFSVSKLGVVTAASMNLVAAGTFRVELDGAFRFNAGTRIKGASNGILTLTNNGSDGFTAQYWGPTTGNTGRGSSSWTNGLVTIDMATATGTGTGTITSPTTAIPANSYVIGMTCKVTTILAGAGLTTISIGDGTDPDKWGTGIAIAAGTTVNFGAHTAGPSYYGTATSIVITADAGVLSTGVLSCSPIIISATPIGS